MLIRHSEEAAIGNREKIEIEYLLPYATVNFYCYITCIKLNMLELREFFVQNLSKHDMLFHFNNKLFILNSRNCL